MLGDEVVGWVASYVHPTGRESGATDAPPVRRPAIAPGPCPNVGRVSPDPRLPARRAKVVCTLGPASTDAEVIDALVDAGMDVARLNLSYGGPEEHARATRRVRVAARRHGRTIAVLADLAGPKIRVGAIDGERQVSPGDVLRFLDAGLEPQGPDELPTTYAGLSADVRVEDSILLRDGAIPADVVAVDPGVVTARIAVPGTIKTGSGINLPDTLVSAPPLGDDDAEALRAALDYGVDLVALSFVRSPDDVVPVREAMAAHGRRVPIIAKIEKPSAVQDLGAVIDAFDGVMVARGDLGVELDLALVPMVQKRIVSECRRAAKPVIVATEMLESMTSASRPTRAEASDVVNAVLDGADALMLSAETSIGTDPVRAVATMDRLIRIAERDGPGSPPRPPVELDADESTVLAAIELADRCRAEAIVVVTRTGSTALRVAAHRPSSRLIVFAPDDLSEPWTLLWGAEVADYLPPGAPLPDDLRGALADEFGVAADAPVVVVTGSQPGATDLVWRT